MSDVLHLVKIPVRSAQLAAFARRRNWSVRELDEGYVAHGLLRQLWQDKAPAPFVATPNGRVIDIWGYTTADAAVLVDHVRAFGDPELVAVLADPMQIASKPMPLLTAGRRIGFTLRACPVVRLGRGAVGHRPGAEVDAFLARCAEAGPEALVSREHVYQEWLVNRIERSESGARPLAVRVRGMSRERLMRRTQGAPRRAVRLERPDVSFAGELVVRDGDMFMRWLARGVGRHRAFGFGALMLAPPGRGGAE